MSKLEGSRSIEAPICVIGSGVAGLLLARRLVQRGKRVVVIESGGASFDEAIHDLNAIEDEGGRYTRAMTGRYRGLGGSSTQWGGRMIPISAHETEHRPYLDAPAWPLPQAKLQAYGPEIERMMGLSEGSFGAEVLDDVDPAGAFPRRHPDFTARWAKWPSFRRCNLALTLKGDIETLELLHIWLESTVCGFELDPENGRLAAIKACSLNGRTLTVRAGRFVFAAGTIETTRLLLSIDAASNGRAFERTQVLGRYFQDHLNVDVGPISRRDLLATNRLFGYHFVRSTRRSLHLELSAEAQREEAVGSGFAYVHMDLAGSPLGAIKKLARGRQRLELDVTAAEALDFAKNLGLIARSAYWRYRHRQLFVPESVSFRLQVCLEQLPQWGNRITLSRDRDRLGLPKARLQWRPGEADERTFRAMTRRLQAYWAKAGFDRLCPVGWSAAVDDPRSSFVSSAEDYAHPSGSTRMGIDPAHSIVGPDLRCHHIPNVSVVGSAIFPTAGSANPTFTIMQLALHLGDILR